MPALERILVPTDFSDTAEIAMTYGSELANAFQATLHLVNVIEDVTSTGGARAGERHRPPPPPLIQPMEDQAMQVLKMAVAKLQPQPSKAVLAIQEGSPFVEIVRYARKHAIDLIVIGTHGHGPVAHLLLGSVAENLVRQAPCPVMTIRHPAHTFVKP